VLREGDEIEAIDAATIDVIAQRVSAALRDDLAALAAELLGALTPEDQLTVGQVARRLGVARSTVYAHWREWGGYKLGAGEKAPIRFDSALPVVKPTPGARPAVKLAAVPRKRRRRSDLVSDEPRLVGSPDGIS
jgi:transposase-like protein